MYVQYYTILCESMGMIQSQLASSCYYNYEVFVYYSACEEFSLAFVCTYGSNIPQIAISCMVLSCDLYIRGV